MRRCARLVLGVLAVGGIFLGAPVARAHTVETVDGRVHEGRILIDNDQKVVIATTFGDTVTVPRAQVKAVDTTTPPLRDQLAFRADLAKDDVGKLWDLHKWAKDRGFREDLTYVLQRILELDPKNAKAHRMLGHEKVDGVWMSPEEKEAHLKGQLEAEMKAKGLVFFEGQWVTPEDKEAMEKGLLKDGDDWVTEEEYHRRRGEILQGGKWIRLGEKEGTAWFDTLGAERIPVEYEWSPHFDVYYDVETEHADRVREGAEAAFQVFRDTLQPTPQTWPAGVEGRIRLHLFNKLPAYARFAQFFDGVEKCSELVRGWLAAVKRQHSFWWVQPVGVVGVYKFPNTPRTFVSNAVHSAGEIILTQFRFNYRFPAPWLLEGFAYFLEMEALGYSDTFSVAQAGSAAASASGAPVWADSDKWREALKALVADGNDPPIKRISEMSKEQLGYVELVKCWSVIEFLAKDDVAKFREWVAAWKDRDGTQEDALKKVYRWDWRELDRRWRAWVTAGFGLAPPPPAGEKE